MFLTKRAFARSLRAKATDAEIALWRLLRSRRLAAMKSRRQAPIGEWIVDFVSFEQRLIVEADGGQQADSEHDIRRDQDLTARGFRVLRFWNNDILLKQTAVVEAIFANVSRSPSLALAPQGRPLPRGEREERPTQSSFRNSE